MVCCKIWKNCVNDYIDLGIIDGRFTSLVFRIV